ncbi:glycolate oxidase subunit GlcF [Kiloniella laminariae]|uniref:Glycolate oxidase iron-sulfur subunit n=1 Tax=Kiloniella laminariae TaxID=454162 RepID=A0ABT4LIE9_9PROT|nr:glycolate oxidase subunit GlcF [Kiloniella laminariae]MCZ4280873.1 glycolate oxidase subunit GlcF [Kiloniella laminariae]
MQTNFSLAQLADPAIAEAEDILRKCVHCGFCTATCPTYVLLGDELDSPRGRIYLIKGMLEEEKPATAEVAKHLDRCLSCLSCMTTCPSGVNYMHLVDHARNHVEATFRRPWHERLLRNVLAELIPRPFWFRGALNIASISAPFVRRFVRGRLRALLDLAPKSLPAASVVDRPQTFAAKGERRARVALLSGCAQTVLAPSINEATIRLLTRLGIEVVIAKGVGCCGSLVHHMGKEEAAEHQIKQAITGWMAEIEGGGLDAIITNASGCGTTVKDYGFMLRNDPDWSGNAAKISELACDITEYLETIEGIDRAEGDEKPAQIVAYHAPCSIQHGQKIVKQPRSLLTKAGFEVRDVPEGHLCCGSAGTYNIMQPELASKLRDRKVRNIESLQPDIIATGNIGCQCQISGGTGIPVVHTVELLDWATGGPKPVGLN